MLILFVEVFLVIYQYCTLRNIIWAILVAWNIGSIALVLWDWSMSWLSFVTVLANVSATLFLIGQRIERYMHNKRTARYPKVPMI